MATYGGARVSDTDALRLRGIITAPAPVWRPTEFRIVDDQPDEAVDALLWAIAELAGERDETRDAKFESLHPRGPHGKFRTIAERVLHALEQHVDGKGDGDPLKEFNREQLRKVAVARGISLPRGASEDYIKHALHEHVAGKVAAKATPVKAAAATKAGPSTPDLTGKAGPSTEPVEGARAGKLPPVQVSVDATSGSDTGKWRASEVSGLSGSPNSLLTAITHRVRTSGHQANDHLRFPSGRPPDPLEAKHPWLAAEAAARRVKDAAIGDRDIKALDRAMEQSPLPSAAVLWRGVRPADVGLPDGDATGFEWTDVGFVGTSANRDVAEHSFAQGALLRIVAPAGTRAIAIHGGGEHEVLLDRGQRFRVVAEHANDDGGRLLDVELVPAPAKVTAKATPVKAAAVPTPGADPLASFRTMSPEAARDALDLRKVPELKKLLGEAGLPVSGRKRDLVDRLVEHVHGGVGVEAPSATAPTKKVRKAAVPTAFPLALEYKGALARKRHLEREEVLMDVGRSSEGLGVQAPGRQEAMDYLLNAGYVQRNTDGRYVLADKGREYVAAKTAKALKQAPEKPTIGVPVYRPPATISAQDQTRAMKLVRRDPEIFANVRRYEGERISTPGLLSNEEADWLQALRKQHPAFVERLAQTARIDQNLARAARAAGSTPAQFKAEVAARLKEAFAGKPVGIRVTSEETLRAILNDGRFKTQFEGAKRAPGLHASVDRRRLGEETFGVPADVDPALRPIYGYIMPNGIQAAGIGGDDGNDLLSAYGRIQVVLKAETRARTTATIGDSLDRLAFTQVSPVDNPTAFSATPTWGWSPDKIDEIFTDYFRRSNYVEAQIHGGIKTGDIAEVVFPTQPSEATRRALAEAGISWRVMA